MINRVVLVGRLTKDPELRQTNNGKSVATFTLAVDRRFKSANGDREADFIDIVAWGILGEICAKYLEKGKLAAVDGSLQIRSYKAKDGTNRNAASVVAEDVKFLSPRDKASTEDAPMFDSSDDDLPF
ncbi:MAG: single-stranded DNA-binding protein [Thermacetogeniaceae bacterium]|jgi:single-strand DNA-binding protein